MRHVIVGNGAAGYTAASTIRLLDPQAQVTVVTDEPHPFYSRVLTSYFIAGRVSEEDVFLARAGEYHARGITLLAGRKAVAAGRDGEEGWVELEGGTALAWDRLLLATGSEPVRLDAPGADLAGVFNLRTLADARAILARARPGETALVVGGGMIGFKATEGLLGLGMRVVMAVSSPRVLSQALDEEAGHLVGEMLARHGVTVLTGVDVAGLARAGDGLVAYLSDGRPVPCALVVVGKGVRPRLELARRLGLEINRGVLCDEHMAASSPGVFAAGDVAEVYDPSRGEPRVNALWPNAVAQGRVAGANMVRGPCECFWGGIGRNVLCLGETGIASGGVVSPRGNGYREVKVRGPGFYRKLVLQGDRPVGAIFVGDLAWSGVVMAAIQSGQPASDLAEAFRTGRLYPAYVRQHAFYYRRR
ncbi:MAG: FAD-dependent oxidoreductase [Bacillota bacterium]|nr:FAD-dependent oxidoreductase [Bacillota bacterium]